MILRSAILPFHWRPRLAVSLVAQQQWKPSSVSWVLAAGLVPCSDRGRESFEPAVTHGNVSEKCAEKIPYAS